MAHPLSTGTDSALAEARPLLAGAARTAGYAVLYAAAIAVGRATRLESGQLSLVWPAVGVATLWLLGSWRSRCLRLDAAALVGVTAVVNVLTGLGPGLALFFGLVNLVDVSVVCALLRRGGRELGLREPRDLLRLSGAALLGAAATAGLGPVALWWTAGDDLPVSMGLWVLRNTVGVLVVLLVVLTLPSALRRRAALRGLRELRGLGTEVVALGTVTVAVVTLVFFLGLELPLAFLVVPLGAWAALRLPTGLAVAHTAIVGVVVLAATLIGEGPFAVLPAVQRAAVAQAFVLTSLVVTALLALYRDDRERLLRDLSRARGESADQARLLEAVIDSISDAVVVVSNDGSMPVYNPAAETLLPWSGGGPGAGVPLYELLDGRGTAVPPEHRPLVRAMAGVTVPRTDYRVRTVDGERVLAVTARPVDMDPEHVALAVFHDVTHDRTREAELSAFAGSVAHDLGNPLTALDGWLEVGDECLTSGRAGDLAEAVVAVGQARQASARMRGLIRDLLDYSTARGAVLDMGDVALGDLVDDVLADHMLGAAADVPAVVWAGQLPVVRGDAALLRQVVANLVGNAVKYRRLGRPPEMTISGGQGAADAPAWLEITDNGVGIPEGEHELVFEEFRQASTSDRAGTGLGLAICRRIVSRHGGRISARPASAGGTTIRIEFPARSPAPA